MPDLELVEQVYLLGIKKHQTQRWLHGYELGGAYLASLCLHGKVSIETRKESLVEVLDRSPTRNRIYDECLAQIVRKKRRVSADAWVHRFSSRKQYRKVAMKLCQRQILRPEGSRPILFFFNKNFQLVHSTSRDELVDRLRIAIFEDSELMSVETRMLIAIASASRLLPRHFEKKKLKKRKARIAEIVEGDTLSRLISKAVKSAMQSEQAANNAGIVAMAGMSS